MIIGYARVSTDGQNPARQEKLLQEAGCEKIYLDKLSGKDTNRPELQAMLLYIRDTDLVIVESISRLARSTRDLLNLIDAIQEKGADFRSIKEDLDTRTPTGKFCLTIFAAMAELERDTILQRQREGIALAKAAGKYTGRQRKTFDEKLLRETCKRWRAGELTAKEAQSRVGLKPNTFYRRVKELNL